MAAGSPNSRRNDRLDRAVTKVLFMAEERFAVNPHPPRRCQGSVPARGIFGRLPAARATARPRLANRAACDAMILPQNTATPADRSGPMIRTLLYNTASGELLSGGTELLGRWQQDPDTLIWADFTAEPAHSELPLLNETFGIHPLAIQDAQRDRHPPKLEDYGDHSFILLKELSPHSVDIDFATVQLAILVGARFLVTRHHGTSPGADKLYHAVAESPQLFAEGLGALAMRLCRTLVDRYLKILLELEPRLEELEQQIIDNPRDTLLTELLGYKTDLKKFRRVFIYHEQIFQKLKTHSLPALGTAINHQITDVYEHQERAGSLAALYYELASDMADGYISVASHHLNQIMKILTIVMAIFVPLSFLAGVYGMNFENMPELHSRSGYFILLSIMAGIAVTLLLLFKKKRWL